MAIKSVGRCSMCAGWAMVVSVLFATCAVKARVWQQNEVESDLLLNFGTLSDSSDIYKNGSLNVALFKVKEQPPKTGPPKPLLIASPDPEEGGVYPVIVFQHGFNLANKFYSQMMYHVASHGFIVVAPQMYSVALATNATSEICNAVKVIDWISMPHGLSQVLSERFGASVKPNLTKVALAGHSRGGKVAFGVATGVCGNTSLKLSAIATLDPVDGVSATEQTSPPILHHSPHDLKLGMPSLIVGSGLGPDGGWYFFVPLPPCAPRGVNHAAFFNESDAPAFHFVAPEYGHMDFLNDDTGGLFGIASYTACNRNEENGRNPMRRFSGGILVAFFTAALTGDNSELCAAVSEKSEAPVNLDKPETNGNFCLSNALRQA